MTEWLGRKRDEAFVVPWYNPEEFLKVYDQLYSLELSDKRDAVEQIAVWESRCFPSLPAAIEATVCLTRAIIQDTLFNHGTTLCQERDIEMLYSMALIRFVNLAIEVNQSSSVFVPNAWVAQKMGIPAWIVDLRNAASHSNPPSLAVLRIGADAAMKYIESTYWRAMIRNLHNIVNEPVDCDEIKNLILRFQVHQYKMIGYKKKSEDSPENAKEMKQILKSIRDSIQNHQNAFIETLIMDGLFISFEDDLKLMLTKREFAEFYDDNSASSDETKEDDTVKCSLPLLPKTLEKFWYPVLKALNANNAIPDFLELLLYSQATRDETGQRLLASWVIRILKIIIVPASEGLETPLEKVFKASYPLIDWERMLFAAVSSPCIYTPYYFPLIACHLDLEESYLRSLMNLLAISQGLAISTGVNQRSKEPVFTIENLKKSMKLQELKLKHKKKEAPSIWSLAPDDMDWSSIPLGTVFKSAPGDKSEIVDAKVIVDFADESKYPESFIYGNKNGVMKEDITVEQNTVLDDIKLLRERTEFLYKR